MPYIASKEQKVAYRAVRTNISRGLLTRPETCERCGSRDTKEKSGRHTIQAHHEDYSRQLDVEWLCAKCHREETPLPEVIGKPNYGDKNGSTKIPDKEIFFILTSGLSGPVLAKKYGVDRSTINKIKRGVYRKSAAPDERKE